jgi:hypothetical protein
MDTSSTCSEIQYKDKRGYAEKITIYSHDNLKFVHFATRNQCAAFIEFLSSLNININHACCCGIGCGIKDIEQQVLDNLVSTFMQRSKLFR